jgi:hypothetical protein
LLHGDIFGLKINVCYYYSIFYKLCLVCLKHYSSLLEVVYNICEVDLL